MPNIITEPVDIDWFGSNTSTGLITEPVDLDFHPDELAKMKKENNSGPIDSFSSGWVSGIGQQGQRNAWDQYSNFVNARPSAVKREAGLRDIEALGVSPDSLDYHKPETVDGDNLWDGRATMPTFQEFITMPEDQIPASLREARRNFTEGYQQQQKYQTDYHWRPGERTNFVGHSLGQAGPDMVDALAFAGLTGGVSSGVGLTGALSSGAARGMAAVGGGQKLQSLAGMVAGSAPAGIAASSIESNAEGYGAYQEAIDQGRSHNEAMEIADSVIAKNYMVNPVTNTLEFATTFGPVKLKGTGPLWKLLKVGGGVAMNAAFGAGEEGAQEIIKRDALDQPIEFDQEMIDNLVAGGVMGGGFHAAGRAATSIINHPVDIDIGSIFQANPEGQLSYLKDNPTGEAIPGEHFDIKEGVDWEGVAAPERSATQQLIWEYGQEFPDDRLTVTEGLRDPNAAYGSETSWHKQGKGIDLWSDGILNDAAKRDWLVNRAQELGFGEVLDEVTTPSARATGPHFHLANFTGESTGGNRSTLAQSSRSEIPNIPTAPDPFAEGIGEIKTIAKPEDVRDRIGRVVDGDKSINYKMPVRKVTETEATLVKELTGIDVSGYTHKIDMNSIRHSMKRHGEGRETSPDQVGMTKEDYQYIPDVINSPDRIIAGNDSKTKQKTLRYEKNIGGQIIVVEEVLPMNKTLITKTAYKKSLSQALADENINRGHTSETVDNTTPNTPPTPNIDQNSESGKSYMAAPMMGGIYDGMQYGDGRSDGQTVSRRDVMDKIKDLVDIPIRHSRLGKSGVRGWHNPKSGIIRIGERFDFDTIAHEIGHHLDNRLGGLSKDPKYAAELSAWVQRQFGDAYSPEHHSSEGVAEFMRQYMTHPEAAQSNFPSFFKEFDVRLKANPKAAKKIAEVKQMFDVWRTQSPEDRAVGSISYSDQKKSAVDRKEAAKDALNKAYDHMVDEFAPIDRMIKDIEKTIGRKLPENLQVYEKARLFRGWAGKAEKRLLKGDGKSPAFIDIVKLIGDRRKEFGAYLVALREVNARNLQKASEAESDRKASEAESIQKILDTKLATKDFSEWVKTLEGDYREQATALRKEMVKLAKEERVKLARDERDERVAEAKKKRIELVESAQRDGKSVREARREGDILIKSARIEGSRMIQKARKESYSAKVPESVEYTYALTAQDTDSIVRKYQSDTKFQQARKMLRDYNNAMLDQLVEGGMKTQEDVDYLKTKWPDYVPFYRDFSDEAATNAFIAAKGIANVSDPIKVFQGSKRDIIDPIESILKNTFDFTNRVEANKVGQALIELSKLPGVGKFVEEVAGNTDAGEGVLSVWIDGEKHVFQVPKDVHAAMTGLNSGKLNPVIKFLSKFEGVLRMASTVMEPAFAITNTIRDSWAAFTNAKYGFIPAWDNLSGVVSYLRQDPTYWEWLDSGGANANLVALDRNEAQKSLNRMSDRSWLQRANWEQVREVLSYISELSEVSTRIGVYKRARDKGASIHEAALESRDVTIDFGRVGATGKHLNKILAFFNAQIQDIDKFMRVAKERPFTTGGRIATGIAGFSALLFMAQHDDERWKELSRRDRDRFWVVIPGALSGDKITKEKWDQMIKSGMTADQILERSGTIWKIPKPFTVGVIFGSGTERALDYVMNDNPEAFKGFADTVWDITKPNMMPVLMKQATEWSANYSYFRDRPIVPQNLQGLPDKLQYDSRTSEVGKMVGDTLDVSPMKVDNAVRGMGGLFGLGLKASDAIIAPENKRPELKWNENYGISRITSTPFSFNQSVTDFYDDYRKQNQLAEEFKITGTKSDDFDPSYFNRLKANKKTMDSLTKRERGVIDSPTLTSEQKRKEIDKIGLEKLKVAQRAINK